MFILEATDIEWAVSLKLSFEAKYQGKMVEARYEERKSGHHYYAVYYDKSLILGECMDCDAHRFGSLELLRVRSER